MRIRVNDCARLQEVAVSATWCVRCQWKFLERIWRRHREGSVCLAARRAGSRCWKEVCFDWETERGVIRRFLADHPADRYDLYFCPNAFREAKRLTALALPTPYAWCDIDGADPAQFIPSPTILVETSPGRYQGIWELKVRVAPEIAEGLSKGLAYDFAGDRNGWSVTKLLRIPFSVNHKPAYDRPKVRLRQDTGELIPLWSGKKVHRPAPLAIDVDPDEHGWEEVYERFRHKVPILTRRLVKARKVLNPDRSAAIYAIVSAFHAARASPDEIAAILWRNPHFVDKYGQNLSRLNEELGRILSKLGGSND